MKIQKPRAIDIIPNFTLLSDLSYSQNIVFNYAKQTLDKALTISRSMNFIARSAAQAAYKALEEKYEILTTDKTGLIKINYQFTPTMINYKVKNGTGRPSSKSIKDAPLSFGDSRESAPKLSGDAETTSTTTTTNALNGQLQSSAK